MGDQPGHPFRGNQYTANPSAMTPAKFNATLEKVRKARDVAYRHLTADAPGHESLSDTKKRLGPEHPAVRAHEEVENYFQKMLAEIRARTGSDYLKMPHNATKRVSEALNVETNS